jgi:hypothetical protein
LCGLFLTFRGKNMQYLNNLAPKNAHAKKTPDFSAAF